MDSHLRLPTLEQKLWDLCYAAAHHVIATRGYIPKIRQAYGDQKAQDETERVARVYADKGVVWLINEYGPANPGVNLAQINVSMDIETAQMRVDNAPGIMDELAGMFEGLLSG